MVPHETINFELSGPMSPHETSNFDLSGPMSPHETINFDLSAPMSPHETIAASLAGSTPWTLKGSGEPPKNLSAEKLPYRAPFGAMTPGTMTKALFPGSLLSSS